MNNYARSNPLSDNFVTDPGSGGVTFAGDDITGVQYPILKLAFGALDSATLVSSSAGLPVAQQGTWNITNVSGTVSLPTGAATSAKQPALGTAGSASTDVLTVQGISSMTPLLATLSGTNNIATVTTVTGITNVVHVDDNSGSLTVDGTVGVSGTVTVDSELTTTDVDTGAGTDTRAVVALVYGHSGGGVLVSDTNPLPIGDNGGSLTVDNGGTFAVQATQSGTWNVGTLTTITNVVHVDDNAGSLTVDNAGTFAVQATQSGTWTVQPGNTANTTAWKVDASSVAVPVTDNSGSLTVDNAGTFAVQVTAATSGGLSTQKYVLAASTNAQSVKASAGQLYAMQASNIDSTPIFIKLYNKASAPTVGTDTPVKTIMVPANATAANGAGVVLNFGDTGLAFATGIAIAVTGGLIDSDTTSTSANKGVVNFDYK